MKHLYDEQYPNAGKCKYCLQWLKKMVLLIISSAVIGTILLLLTGLIPQSVLYEKVVRSSEILGGEGGGIQFCLGWNSGNNLG